jgi:hypothetical protein
MKKYLSTLHQKSDSHKRRFAFLTSGLITLIIFTFWSMALFGNDQSVIAEKESQEVSPLASLKDGVASSVAGLNDAFAGIKYGLKEMVDLQSDYEEMKSGVIETYGQ